MSWNHRVVEIKDLDGKCWQEICEVHYDDKDVPVAYTNCHLVATDSDGGFDGLRAVLQRMTEALNYPVLRSTDFTGDESDI